MKKALVCMLCILSMFLFVSNVKADNKTEDTVTLEAETNEKKVTVYIFSKDGCPHCIEAEQFLETLSSDKEYGKYFKVVNYQVYDANWKKDSTNMKIMESVAKEFGDEVEGVPYIVIGDSYTTNGYASSLDDEIKAAIKENFESDKYVDVVSKYATGSQIEEKNNDSIIIIGILVAVVGGCGALVYFSRKK